MSNLELAKLLADYKGLKEMMSELQDELAGIEEKIKSHMGEQEELKIMGNTVKWTKYQTSRFDSKVFAKEHAVMYSQYVKTTPARRFSIA